jgi:hypothetical protein
MGPPNGAFRLVQVAPPTGARQARKCLNPSVWAAITGQPTSRTRTRTHHGIPIAMLGSPCSTRRPARSQWNTTFSGRSRAAPWTRSTHVLVDGPADGPTRVGVDDHDHGQAMARLATPKRNPSTANWVLAPDRDSPAERPCASLCYCCWSLRNPSIRKLSANSNSR